MVMKLRNIHGFNRLFDIEVGRVANKIRVQVLVGNTILYDHIVPNGSDCEVIFW